MLAIVFLLAFAKNLIVFQPAVLPYYYMLTTEIVIWGDPLIFPDPLLQEVDRYRNAVWLEHKWFQGRWTEEEAEKLAEDLKRNGIIFVYPHLSPTTKEGVFPDFSVDSARRFRAILKRENPEMKILPWVGGVQRGYRQQRPGTFDLDSDSYRKAFIRQCVLLTDGLGFDGIHLNIEPVESGDKRLPQLLNSLKAALGDSKILSVAASKPSFLDGLNLSPLRSWDMEYFVTVGRYCDQLVIMSYDTGLPHPLLYTIFVMKKTAMILHRFSHNKLSCRILLGVPTYDDAPSHHEDSENVRSALKGLLSALKRAGKAAGQFEGVALYAYWTTEEEEWREFSEIWLNR